MRCARNTGQYCWTEVRTCCRSCFRRLECFYRRTLSVNCHLPSKTFLEMYKTPRGATRGSGF